MNIVVSLNANYLRPLCVMLRSLLDANPGEKADVYVLHASLSPEAFSFARSALPDGRLRLFDVRVPEDFMADAPVLFHFPKEMYYRIFSARLLPQTLGRALYLDPDMVINRPLAPLYGMELGEHFFAAARSVNPVSQVEYKLRLDMPEESEYFNSGVLLMNLDALRAGQPVACPTYDYTVHNRAAETITVVPAKVVVVEGILIFAEPELRERLDIKIFVDTDADVRILRRIVRDVRDRGRDLESIVTQYLTTMHEMFVEPSKRYADIIIPEGGHNQVALDFVMERIRAYVKERD